MDPTDALADRLRSSDYWRNAPLVAQIEAAIGDRRGVSAKELLAIRLERAFGEVFSWKQLRAIRWGELAKRLLEAT